MENINRIEKLKDWQKQLAFHTSMNNEGRAGLVKERVNALRTTLLIEALESITEDFKEDKEVSQTSINRAERLLNAILS